MAGPRLIPKTSYGALSPPSVIPEHSQKWCKNRVQGRGGRGKEEGEKEGGGRKKGGNRMGRRGNEEENKEEGKE